MRIRSDTLTILWQQTAAQNPDLSVLLFDLDGTLVDTMALHYQAYAHALAQYGGQLTHADFNAFSGPPAAITIPRFAKAAGLEPASIPAALQLHAEKKVQFEALLQETQLTLLPSADLLRQAKNAFGIAIVTSGNTAGARAILKASGLGAHVDVLITGDDVTHGKPDPEPYQLALLRLGKDPKHGLAFEDHDNGIEAATRAGLPVIDVRNNSLIPARASK